MLSEYQCTKRVLKYSCPVLVNMYINKCTYTAHTLMCAKRKRRNMGTDGKINCTIKSQRNSQPVSSARAWGPICRLRGESVGVVWEYSENQLWTLLYPSANLTSSIYRVFFNVSGPRLHLTIAWPKWWRQRPNSLFGTSMYKEREHTGHTVETT